jgi:virulence factor Mce-like protein
VRRVAAAVLALAALGLGISSTVGQNATAESTFRVDAIFDTSKGIIPGQLVKVAGARVGTVKDVNLTPDYRARIQMSVDRRFAPFRSDAQCQIRPEGLISENFVECDPGTPSGSPLPAKDGHPPTVPVENTSLPVNLSDLFNIWRTPVNQRLSLVLASLGAGVAGRGDDLNEILRRAHPTLTLTRRAIRILNGQRSHLANLIRSTDQVVSALAAKRKRVRVFIERSARVTQRTADRKTALSSAIARLPALLDATRPALARLDEIAVAGTPILTDLQASAPGVNRLLDRIGPFAKAARPALDHLSTAAAQGIKTARSASPVVRLLRRLARGLNPVGTDLNRLLVDAQARGVVENLLLFAYHGAALTARFDAVSHLGPTRPILPDCSGFANITVPACNANWGPGTAAARQRSRKRSQRRSGPASNGTTLQAPAPSARKPRDLLAPLRDLLPSLQNGRLPALPQGDKPAEALEDLLDFLLR